MLNDLRAESVAARAERASLFDKIAADALVADAQRRELMQTLQTVIGMSRGNPVMVASMSPPSPQQAQPPHATSVSSASTTVSMAADPLLMDQLRAAEVDRSKYFSSHQINVRTEAFPFQELRDCYYFCLSFSLLLRAREVRAWRYSSTTNALITSFFLHFFTCAKVIDTGVTKPTTCVEILAPLHW